MVELDLPVDPDGGDPYEHAAKLLEQWKEDGALVEDEEPAIWAVTQDYTAPDGRQLTRRGFLARVRLAEYGEGHRAHERTQPGPKEDRLRLTRATKHNLSPIFSLYPGDAWPQLEPGISGDPWGEVDRRRRHRPPGLAGRRPRRPRRRRRRAGRGRAADRRRPPPLRDRARPTRARSAARATTTTC